MISDKIKTLQKQNKISQGELAELIGMTKNGFQVALKKNEFKASTLKKIADALKVPIGYFFEEDEPENSTTKVKHNLHETTDEPLGNWVNSRVAALEEKVKMLNDMLIEKEKMIEEKERLIKILMERNG